MSRRERMTSVDTAWLRMDRPHNLMTIVGVLLLDRVPDLGRLRKLFIERFLAYPRFRQRALSDATGSYWEDDPAFDIKRHVRAVRLPGAADDEALKAYVAALAATPFDPAHPMWQMHVVRNYTGGAAVVSRVHHAYADGIALIGVMLSLTDPAPDAPTRRDPAHAARAARQASAAVGGVLGELLEPVTDALSSAARLSGRAMERSFAILRDPAEAAKVAHIGASVAAEIAQLATMQNDSPTRFKGKPGVAKRVAWTTNLPLEHVKSVGRVFGCSVNDVLLACVAGALGRYLAHRGESTEGVEIRSLVPVNLRPPGKESRLGNRFGLVALVLPVGIANPVERLHAVHARMEALKQSYQAAVTLGMLGLVGLCPKPVQEQILDLLAAKATAVMTNVPGPQQQLYIAGVKLVDMMFWVPQSGDIGMGVSVLSYNGGVQFGVITDANLVDDPDALVAGFQPEFEQLLLTALMEPWDMVRDPTIIDAEIAQAEARLAA